MHTSSWPCSRWRPPRWNSDTHPVLCSDSEVCWICVLAAFAVAFHPDNLVEDEAALDFPGEKSVSWTGCMDFALPAMAAFGTTDVTVMSREMRRTVAANATVAFVFSTVIVADLVAALDRGQGA
ncbi:DUF1345 domain-containing protein [Streptomyces sindenensis]|uniref:DUF1345 domain-containing protein n=1 Tax=Streptomyces sindenensis TaxID=67363 RepID=UPI0016793EB7